MKQNKTTADGCRQATSNLFIAQQNVALQRWRTVVFYRRDCFSLFTCFFYILFHVIFPHAWRRSLTCRKH